MYFYPVYGINELISSTFLFGTTIADWLMKRAMYATKAGTNRRRAIPSDQAIRFKQEFWLRPFY